MRIQLQQGNLIVGQTVVTRMRNSRWESLIFWNHPGLYFTNKQYSVTQSFGELTTIG